MQLVGGAPHTMQPSSPAGMLQTQSLVTNSTENILSWQLAYQQADRTVHPQLVVRANIHFTSSSAAAGCPAGGSWGCWGSSDWHGCPGQPCHPCPGSLWSLPVIATRQQRRQLRLSCETAATALTYMHACRARVWPNRVAYVFRATTVAKL